MGDRVKPDRPYLNGSGSVINFIEAIMAVPDHRQAKSTGSPSADQFSSSIVMSVHP